MIDNVVDEASDVALDCEWCTDVVIARNTVRNGHNAGISLFLSCRNVVIEENTVWLYEDSDDPLGLGCKLLYRPCSACPAPT
eukprot:SAG31_NODE_610_length_13564_cov_3.189528_13_plen_82_part_00